MTTEYRRKRDPLTPDPRVTFGCVHDPEDEDVGVTATCDGVSVTLWVSNIPSNAVITWEDITEAAATLLHRRLRKLAAIN